MTIICVEREFISRKLYRSTLMHNGKRYERTSTKSYKEDCNKADGLKIDLEAVAVDIYTRVAEESFGEASRLIGVTNGVASKNYSEKAA